MRVVLAVVFPLFAAAAPVPAQARELRLPALLSDHAVLQRGTAMRVWGHASSGAEVRATASWGHEASSRADESGAFELRLQPPDAVGPHEVTITSGAHTRTLRDLWFGEVWVCGGQSNMEWTLGPGVGKGIADWENEVAAADIPQIRVFDVPNVTSALLSFECDGAWKVCTPQNARTFSAVGYLFGRELQRELDVPIGLIVSCWGGTVAEAWTPEPTLVALGDFADGLEKVKVARTALAARPISVDQLLWVAALHDKDPGEKGGWKDAGFDDAAWPNAQVPGPWDGEMAQFDGAAWYRRAVEVPAAWAGKDLCVSLGAIDDLDTAWFGGVRIGGMETGEPWSTPRTYTVPGKDVRAGKTTLVVRVIDTGGAGGFTGTPSDLWFGPADDEKARKALAGAWRMHKGASMQTLGAWPHKEGLGPNTPTVLYNAMIAPLANLAIRGAIFYQGESNVGAPLLYRRLFPAMIGAWRQTFRLPEMPFYYVQIAPFEYGARGPLAAFLREAQAMAMSSVAHVGMAVTMDIGDPKDIHPLNKQDVGKRLALWALADTYGRTEIDPHGPTLSGHTVVGDSVRLEMQHASGLTTKDGGPPQHFTVAGEDRVFHPAQARIENGAILVRSDAVRQPVAVRYAFGSADAGNLVNGSGLPASSFRTDDWPPPLK